MVVGTIEKIQVILQAVTTGFAKGLNKAQAQMKSVGKNMQNFGAVMEMPMKNFKELTGSFKVMKTLGGRVARSFRMLTHGMRGFRMEALGVMFFGMMMQRMFMGLLQPVMEAFGVFDLFRLMLLVLFLPVMVMIFPWLLKIMKWFMDLPEPTKRVIGILVILGAIFGTLIMILGQFALGMGSLIQFIPIFGTAIKALGGFLIGLSATVLAVIAIIVVIIIGMFIAWKENFMNMKQVVSDIFTSLKLMFKGLFSMLTGIFKFWIAVFKGDFKGAKEAIIKAFKGLKDFFIGFVFMVLNVLGAIGIGIIRIFWGVIKTIKDALIALISWFTSKISKFTKKVVGKIAKFAKKAVGVDDFILQPGGRLIQTNPNDTIVGFKGAPPNLGGEGSIIQENNFYGFTMDDLKRELDDRDRRLVDDVRRIVKQ